MNSVIANLIDNIRNLHDPVIVKASPDGDGEIHYRRKGDEWVASKETGPRVRVLQHNFVALGDFCAFVSDRYADAPCDVLVDGSLSRVTCNTQPHEDYHDLISLGLVKHPACKAWEDTSNWMSQQAIVEHLRGFGEYVTDDGGSSVLLAKLLALKLTAKEEWISELDSKGRTVVQSANRSEQMSVVLPDVVTIEIPWFRGVALGGEEPVYRCELLLHMSKDDKGRPIFRFTMPRKALVEHDALTDVVMSLREGLNAVKAAQVGQGRASTERVPSL